MRSRIEKLISDLLATLGAAETTGTHIGIAGLIDLFELMALAKYIRELTFWEAYVLEVFEEELLHVGVATWQYVEDDDAERARQARELAFQHPGTVYLYGDVSLFDASVLAASGFETFRLGIPQSVFQVLTAGEIIETAEVVALL